MKPNELIAKIENGELDKNFKKIYVSDSAVEEQKPRYIRTIKEFINLFGDDRDVFVLSAPGRTEVCGNHTDHNNGKVLAASINLDAIAIAAKRDDMKINEKSEGHGLNEVDISTLSPDEAEYGRSSSMIKGVAAGLKEKGYEIGGFDACTTSDVMGGSGLSSSAAFEVLIATVINHLYNDGKIDAVTVAKAAQFSENVYFGKQSGLMDQMVSSVGGFVWIDFANTEKPVIQKHTFDFAQAGYCLCITDTKGSHADLTPDYVAVPTEMKQVAAYFGKSVLREISAEQFRKAIPRLRKTCSDRAILRAAHFFAESERATAEAKALEDGDLSAFFALVRESGTSSAELLQNLFSCQKPTEQAIPLGIWYSKQFLGEKGAVRVHGGGFAGTIQAFVPVEEAEAYCQCMNQLFGKGSCHKLSVRPLGGVRV